MSCERSDGSLPWVGASSYPDLKKRLLNTAISLEGVSLCIGDQVLQTLGLCDAVLLKYILERHHDIGVRHGGERRRLVQVRERAGGIWSAEGPKAKIAPHSGGVEEDETAGLAEREKPSRRGRRQRLATVSGGVPCDPVQGGIERWGLSWTIGGSVPRMKFFAMACPCRWRWREVSALGRALELCQGRKAWGSDSLGRRGAH